MSRNLERMVAVEDHPVSTQKYVVPTPSIDELYQRVKKCVRMRIPGAIVYAMTRVGKTYAIRYIENMLARDFPGVLCMTVGCERRKVPSETAFFSNLLEAAGHADPDSGTSSQKRRRLMNKLLSMLVKSKQNLLIVFADEAQKLQVDEYEWLREVHDALERKGFRMITFLVGQPHLVNQKTALKEAGETQIVGRFMIDDIAFHGVRTVEQAASCLAGYDIACYPAESPWSFTRFFLPLAWTAGVRLEKEAEPLWEEFKAVHLTLGFLTDVEVPMTYFARAVEIALKDIGMLLDAANFKFTPEIWRQAVLDCKFAAAEEELLLKIEVDE